MQRWAILGLDCEVDTHCLCNWATVFFSRIPFSRSNTRMPNGCRSTIERRERGKHADKSHSLLFFYWKVSRVATEVAKQAGREPILWPEDIPTLSPRLVPNSKRSPSFSRIQPILFRLREKLIASCAPLHQAKQWFKKATFHIAGVSARQVANNMLACESIYWNVGRRLSHVVR